MGCALSGGPLARGEWPVKVCDVSPCKGHCYSAGTLLGLYPTLLTVPPQERGPTVRAGVGYVILRNCIVYRFRGNMSKETWVLGPVTVTVCLFADPSIVLVKVNS